MSFVHKIPPHRPIEPAERLALQREQKRCLAGQGHRPSFAPLTRLQKAAKRTVVRHCQMCGAAHCFNAAALVGVA